MGGVGVLLETDVLRRLAVSYELHLSHVQTFPSALHLCEAAIHKQFRSRDVAAVVGCEKHYGLRNLVGCTEPAERNSAGKHLQALLARFRGSQQIAQSGRVDGAPAPSVHANAAILQL